MSINATTLRRPLRFLALLLLTACVLVFIGGLVFRATVYWRLPVASGDPYGIADVIEYGLGMLLLATAFVGFALGMVLVFVRRLALIRIGIVLLAVSAVSAVSYSHLHTFVAHRTAPAHA